MYELNETQLTEWGKRIGAVVETPVVFALSGDLGAGKSVFARGVATGAGVQAHMPSPTFNLLFSYETPRAVVNHLDLYRLIDEEEVWELGWRDLGADNQIVLIEWPERAPHLLPEPRWEISIKTSPSSDNLRIVSLAKIGGPPEIPLPL